MKGIMAKESSVFEQDVPSLTYSPADRSMPLLFSRSRPLDALKDILVKEFAGRTLPMLNVYREHNVDTPYIKKNYKEALGRLETEKKITANPPAKDRPKNTFADHIVVTFPPRKK
jgi:hypothetical protein